VLKENIAPPTMSLAEYADTHQAEMELRSKQDSENEISAVRR
jgi:hypothetical protein